MANMRFQLFEVEIQGAEVSEFRQTHSRHDCSLSCRECKRGSRRPLPHVVDLPMESATRPFPSAYFRTKVRTKDFTREIIKGIQPQERMRTK